MKVFDISSAIIGMFIGVLTMGVLLQGVAKPYWKEQIIQRGYGLYCPDTGYFAFKGECNNE